MNQSQFDALARSRIVRKYEEAFRIATGFVMKLQPATATGNSSPSGAEANPFCTLMSCRPQSKAVCKKTFAKYRDRAAADLVPARSCCFAGFTHIAIPVLSAGEHIATLYGGQLMLEKPTKQAFEKISHQLVPSWTWRSTSELTARLVSNSGRFRKAIAGDPVSAGYVRRPDFAVCGHQGPGSRSMASPPTATRARRFIQDRYAEPITMPDAARHLGMSATSFSKMFKRELGLTFTQYLTRFRVEKSKGMLVKPTEPIRKIAFQSGFESISQFNRSFGNTRDMSPTEFRASLEGSEPAANPPAAAATGKPATRKAARGAGTGKSAVRIVPR